MIRKATPKDKLDFILLIKQFVREADLDFNTDWDYLLANYEGMVENPEFCIFLLEKGKNIVGVLLGYASTPLFSRDRISAELAWYVDPEYRNVKDGLALLKAFEDWSKEVNCRYCSMMDIHNLRDMSPLYKRKGYKMTEKTYTKEL